MLCGVVFGVVFGNASIILSGVLCGNDPLILPGVASGVVSGIDVIVFDFLFCPLTYIYYKYYNDYCFFDLFQTHHYYYIYVYIHYNRCILA